MEEAVEPTDVFERENFRDVDLVAVFVAWRKLDNSKILRIDAVLTFFLGKMCSDALLERLVGTRFIFGPILKFSAFSTRNLAVILLDVVNHCIRI